eukprot:745818-Hanusia_phi.AAC.4
MERSGFDCRPNISKGRLMMWRSDEKTCKRGKFGGRDEGMRTRGETRRMEGRLVMIRTGEEEMVGALQGKGGGEENPAPHDLCSERSRK